MIRMTVASLMGIFCMAHSTATPVQPTIAPAPGVEIEKVRTISIKSLPRATREIVEADSQMNAPERGKRYGLVPDDEVAIMRDYHTRLIHPQEVSRNMTFRFADISASEFASYPFEGAIPEGPTKEGPWTSMTRVFKRDDSVVVLLREWDFVKDGGGILLIKEMMNTKVANMPARFNVKQSESGAVVSELSWATPKKLFTLTVMDDVSKADTRYNAQWMIRLANSIK